MYTLIIIKANGCGGCVHFAKNIQDTLYSKIRTIYPYVKIQEYTCKSLNTADSDIPLNLRKFIKHFPMLLLINKDIDTISNESEVNTYSGNLTIDNITAWLSKSAVLTNNKVDNNIKPVIGIDNNRIKKYRKYCNIFTNDHYDYIIKNDI